MPGAHRLGDVLQGLLADVVERDIDLAADLPMGVVGDADAARLGDALEARRDIDAVAENIVVVDDDVADMDADAKFDPEFGRHVDIPLRHRALDFHRTARRIDGTGELDQHAVAGGLDDAAAMRGDAGIDQRLPQHLQLRQRAAPRRGPSAGYSRRYQPPAPPPIAGPRARRTKRPPARRLLKHGRTAYPPRVMRPHMASVHIAGANQFGYSPARIEFEK